MNKKFEYLRENVHELFAKTRREYLFNEEFREQFDKMEENKLSDALEGYFKWKKEGKNLSLERAEVYMQNVKHIQKIRIEEWKRRSSLIKASKNGKK